MDAIIAADPGVNLVKKPQPQAMVGEEYTPNSPRNAPNHHQEPTKSPRGGGRARIVKEDNFCGMEDNQVQNEDDLRRDAPGLKVGDRSKET